MLRPDRSGLTMTTISLIAVTLLGSGCTTLSPAPSQTYNAELEYLKSLHQAGPVTDPQLVAFLMQQFMNANQLHAGIKFFESFLQQHGGQLSPEHTGVYLSAVGLLRASYANQVPLLSRISWVNETIEILEHARDLTKNEDFLVRWMIGVVYAQLPERFNKADAALTDLKWCVDNIAKAPHDGWLREPYYHLAVLYDRANNQQQAQAYLHLSGHEGFKQAHADDIDAAKETALRITDPRYQRSAWMGILYAQFYGLKDLHATKETVLSLPDDNVWMGSWVHDLVVLTARSGDIEGAKTFVNRLADRAPRGQLLAMIASDQAEHGDYAGAEATHATIEPDNSWRDLSLVFMIRAMIARNDRAMAEALLNRIHDSDVKSGAMKLFNPAS